MNLVDFDALWGHRRNVEGYGKEIEKFDRNLGVLLEELREDDLLICLLYTSLEKISFLYENENKYRKRDLCPVLKVRHMSL